MAEPIRGKVARVLNPREVAINVGATNGVAVGMYFDIVGREDIKDPDTEEVLGSLDRPKVRVQVTEVKERLSVASTCQGERVNVGGKGLISISLGDFSRALMPPVWVTKYETFHTKEKTLQEANSDVKTGDPVVQIIEESAVEQENASPAP